jgi:serine phosphatase RsbU (regulator of sigma subunit)/pSer/pThr/pTyr-binding forkhead associated (FHA) protein
MSIPAYVSEAVLEVTRPGTLPEFVPVAHNPFLLGRGAETGNHLILEDPRISRNCAAIVEERGVFRIEDRGQRHGVFVNGIRVERRDLRDGDIIGFGLDDSYRLTFRLGQADEDSVENMLTRLGSMSSVNRGGGGGGGLSNLNLLLEATSLLHSSLPLDAVLATMLDHAISLTRADRAALLELDANGVLKVRLARSSDKHDLPAEKIAPSQTALRQAVLQRSPIITDDISIGGLDLQAAESIMAQQLRAIVAIPLFPVSRATAQDTNPSPDNRLLGAIYLDSRGPTAFSSLDCQILAALGGEAASILDNARLVERERERQRMEQELEIGYQIQQGLLPHGLRDYPHVELTGKQIPCHSVGGDYFDVFPLGDRTAFLIADVSGHGLGAALVTTMLQGTLSGMMLGVDPVKVLNHVNRFLCDHAQVGRYATLFFGILAPDGTLDYMRAGHPSPLLVRDGQVTDLYTQGSLPIGILEDAQVAAATTKLDPGDTLVLFTDGVTEAQAPSGEMLEVKKLREIVAAGGSKSVEELQSSIFNHVEEFSRGAEPSDDVTLLILRYRTPVGG